MSITPITSEEQWLSLRAKHIGGSEIAALFDKSSYLTVNQLYNAKRNHYHDFTDTPLKKMGRLIEPIIADFVATEYMWELIKCSDYYEHPQHPTLGATLDYFVIRSEYGCGILEIKNVNSFSPDWTDTRSPDSVELQMQHQLLVVNAARKAADLDLFEWGAIASLHAGNPEDIRVMMRKPDEVIQNLIIERNNQFWKDIEEGNEPSISDPKDYQMAVDLFKAAEIIPEEVVDLSDNTILDGMIAEFEQNKEQLSILGKRNEVIKANIIMSLIDRSTNGEIRGRGLGRTQNFGIEYSVKTIYYKPQPERTTKVGRLNIKGL